MSDNQTESVKTPIILQTRVDNRLIHGQVATSWLPYLKANLAVVANDQAATDEAQQALLQMSAGPNVATRFFTLQQTIDKIHKASAKQHIMLLVEFVQDAVTLVKAGVPLKEVVLGNMHPAPNKTKVTDVIFVDDNDVAAIKELKNLGVNVVIRRFPTDKAKDFFSSYKG